MDDLKEEAELVREEKKVYLAVASSEENESKCEKARHVPASSDGQVHGGGEVRGTAHRFCWCSCGPSTILHDLECEAQAYLCVCGTPHPAITVMGELR